MPAATVLARQHTGPGREVWLLRPQPARRNPAMRGRPPHATDREWRGSGLQCYSCWHSPHWKKGEGKGGGGEEEEEGGKERWRKVYTTTCTHPLEQEGKGDRHMLLVCKMYSQMYVRMQTKLQVSGKKCDLNVGIVHRWTKCNSYYTQTESI